MTEQSGARPPGPPGERTGGRRASTPEASASGGRVVGPALVLVLAVVLPLATLGAMLLVRTEQPTAPTAAPRTTALTRVTLACPSSPVESTRGVFVGSSLAETEGEVALDQLTGAAQPLPVEGETVTRTEVRGPVVVTGEDEWAPGLLAARGSAVAATACAEPGPEAWFAGVGARPGHRSAVELVNPDPGPAVVDLIFYTPTGPLDVAGFRGLRVPGRSATVLDLAEQVPRRTELGLQVRVSRGRLAASVWDSVDRLGTGPSASDWLTPQAQPSTSGTLLGLPRGDGSRRLALVNGGDDETRVTVRVISPESTFAPQGLQEIRVPPQSLRSVSIDAVLAREVRAGAIGLLVESTRPVAASLQTFVGADLTPVAAGPVIEGRGAALTPTGPKQLLLAGSERPGVAVVVARGADGRELAQERVAVGPDRGIRIDLPDRAAYVSLELERTPLVASVLVYGDGVQGNRATTVLALSEVRASGLVPAVRPGLP